MKFFTPELYLRCNSPGAAIADLADDEWEQAVSAYHVHLSRFSTEMTARVRELAEEFCLHDAELLSLHQDITAPPIPPPIRTSVAIISVRSTGRLVNLFYLLWDEIGLSTAPKAW